MSTKSKRRKKLSGEACFIFAESDAPWNGPLLGAQPALYLLMPGPALWSERILVATFKLYKFQNAFELSHWKPVTVYSNVRYTSDVYY
jgi:hypothetical protein